MFQTIAPISPFTEILAYEALWSNKNTSFKSLAAMFARYPGSRPSDFVELSKLSNLTELEDTIKSIRQVYKTNMLIQGTYDFPNELKDAKEPVQLLYYIGNLAHLHTRRVAIVGTRRASTVGLETTAAITKQLVGDNFTIVSGLAAGVDTQAHTSAIEAKGRTIAVLGTPLNRTYPRENAALQQQIAQDHLLISQVPFYIYSKQDHRLNKLFFLERNKTMSALTEATIIIEAGETSGSLTQAAAAVYQKRKLLIWEACFHNKVIDWPKRLVEQGAIRVQSYEDIKKALDANVPPPQD